MSRLLADESFDSRIVEGLIRRRPELDIVRVQDIGLTRTPDPIILEWAAKENRVLLTHDKKTMTKYAYQRLRARQPMPGLLVVQWELGIGEAIEHILVILEASPASEWESQIHYVPL